jgi:hypothetical protein
MDIVYDTDSTDTVTMLYMAETFGFVGLCCARLTVLCCRFLGGSPSPYTPQCSGEISTDVIVLAAERSEVHKHPLVNFPDFRFFTIHALNEGFKKYFQKNFIDFWFAI